jgi:hypothetical protein
MPVQKRLSMSGDGTGAENGRAAGGAGPAISVKIRRKR